MDDVHRRIHIDIWHNGKIYASRYWQYVPRVGEKIELVRPGKDDKGIIGELAVFTIVNVQWGTISSSMDPVVVLDVVLRERASKPKQSRPTVKA